MAWSLGFGVGPLRWSTRLGGRRRRGPGLTESLEQLNDGMERGTARMQAWDEANRARLGPAEVERRYRINRVLVPVVLGLLGLVVVLVVLL